MCAMFATPTRAFTAPRRERTRTYTRAIPRAGLLDAFRGEKKHTRAVAKVVVDDSASAAAPVASLERAIALPDVRDGADGARRGGAAGRRAIMAGNWKMNPKTASEAATLAALVGACAAGETTTSTRACEVLVCPPAPFIADVARIVRV